MGPKYSIPPDGAPKVRALVDQAQAMARNPNRQFSKSDITDLILGQLITIVGELESEITRINAAAKTSERDAIIEGMEVRGAQQS